MTATTTDTGLVAKLYESGTSTSDPTPELWPAQRLRATAVGAAFAEVYPSLNDDDREMIGDWLPIWAHYIIRGDIDNPPMPHPTKTRTKE